MSSEECLVFIGDVHAQYDQLQELLKSVDFDLDDADSMAYCPFVTLVFVGDLIDNSAQPGIDHGKTLALVHQLHQAGRAQCIMGNHEFNAIGFWMRHPVTGLPLREHTQVHRAQHQGFLDEVGEGSECHQQWVEWFMTLPLFVDFGHVRSVHACWDDDAIARLRPYLNEHNALRKEHWVDAFNPEHELYALCELLLKGPETALPEGLCFYDRMGHPRTSVRQRWWLEQATTYRELAQVSRDMRRLVPDLPLPAPWQGPDLDVPVVVGHYALEGVPGPLSNRVICVDYSGASAERPLVSYTITIDEENPGPHFPSESHYFSPWLSTYLGSAGDGMNRQMWKLLEEEPVWQLSSAQHGEFVAHVDEILWRWWDPVNINWLDECRNEYYGYVDNVTTVALLGDLDTLAGFLLCLETTHFGSNHDNTRCGRVARRIMDALHDCGETNDLH